jgi:hypothetical protein
VRREWTDAIKNRRWDELERLAKWEPDQQLCDTVAELEKGIEEKQDRRALRKILWILEKAGFIPSPDNAHSEDPGSRETLQVGFIMSADADGNTPITYGKESNSRFHWLTAYVHEVRGVVRAGTETMSMADATGRIETLRTVQRPPFLSGEIDPGFALWRIKRALARNKPGTVSEAIAFWRSVIDRAHEMPHPAESLKAAKAKPSEMSEDVLLMDATMSWRIELGAATPIMDAMYEAQTAHKDDGPEAQREAVKAAGMEARKQVVTESVIDDHHARLMDLTMLLHQREDPTFGKVLAAAHDLRKRGAESDYAKGLVDKTVVIYVEAMKRTDQSTGSMKQ